MKSNNFALVSLKYFFGGLIKNIIYWPLWWYSAGLLLNLKFTGRRIAAAWQGLGLGVWLKNIFRPMYGQYDVASRLISFMMRLVQIIFRLIILIIIIFFILLIPAVYLFSPVFIVFKLFF